MKNRELKFRAWDTKQKKFITHVPVEEYMLDEDTWSHHDMDEIGGIYPNNIFNHYSFNNRIIFQQYTGMKDKNQKEIYEGDLVEGVLGLKLDYVIGGAVQFYRGCFVIGDTFFNEFTDFEIKGNIFENTELVVSNYNKSILQEDDEDLGLKNCEQCGEEAWDGYICHSCGIKEI